jgi:hypothetical protein
MKTKHNKCWIKLSMINQYMCVCVTNSNYEKKILPFSKYKLNVKFLIKNSRHT